jgi:hypothetical protein
VFRLIKSDNGGCNLQNRSLGRTRSR